MKLVVSAFLTALGLVFFTQPVFGQESDSYDLVVSDFSQQDSRVILLEDGNVILDKVFLEMNFESSEYYQDKIILGSDISSTTLYEMDLRGVITEVVTFDFKHLEALAVDSDGSLWGSVQDLGTIRFNTTNWGYEMVIPQLKQVEGLTWISDTLYLAEGKNIYISNSNFSTVTKVYTGTSEIEALGTKSASELIVGTHSKNVFVLNIVDHSTTELYDYADVETLAHFTINSTTTETLNLFNLGNFVWLDENLDGIQNNNEPGVEANIQIFNCTSNTLMANLVTGVDGYYQVQVPNGFYRMDVIEVNGLDAVHLTIPLVGDNETDSNGMKNPMMSACVEVNNADNMTLDIGVIIQPTDIGIEDQPRQIFLPLIAN